jgi:hypothetical protein
MKPEFVTPDRVREALRATEDIWAGDSHVRVPYLDFFALRTAAASTLPKTKVVWRVKGTVNHHGDDGQDDLGTQDEALELARRWLWEGGSVSFVRQVEVPA